MRLLRQKEARERRNKTGEIKQVVPEATHKDKIIYIEPHFSRVHQYQSLILGCNLNLI